jgi:hypothetical protein
MKSRIRVICILAVSILVIAGPATAAVTAIAVTGQNVPDGNGTFGQDVDGPVLNNAGRVAFRAALSNVSGNFGNDAIYAYSGGALAKIVRENETPPEGNGQYNEFSTPLINGAGQIGFGATLDMTSSPAFDTMGIYRHSGTSIVKIARDNDTEPENNGVFDNLVLEVFNSGGRFAFADQLRNTALGTIDNIGVFKHDGSALVNIVRKNDFVPNGNGRYFSFGDRALNGNGEVAFQAQLSATSGAGLDDAGIYRTSGASILEVVRENSLVPDGGGRFAPLFGPALNNAGQVAFNAFLRDTPLSGTDDSGIYRWSQATGLTKVVRENQLLPEGNGRFSQFDDSSELAEGVVLAGNGHVAFHADLRNTPGGSNDNEGIYLFNGTSLAKSARENDTVPGGNGTFGGFGTPVINAAGHVAFQALLEGTSGAGSDNEAIYLWNGTSLVQAAREGDIIGSVQLGGALTISDGSGGQDGRASGLNDSDQIVFRSGLVVGSGSGIFLFTPGPAPPTGLLGDYNNDGKVDAADYVKWRKNTTNSALPNDNGLTTQPARFNLWRANFGDMLGSGAGGSPAVPEPRSCIFLLVAALHLAVLGRRNSIGVPFVSTPRSPM